MPLSYECRQRGCKVCKVEETETGENDRPYNPRKNDLQTETPRLRSRRDLEEPLRCLAWYIRDRVCQPTRAGTKSVNVMLI